MFIECSFNTTLNNTLWQAKSTGKGCRALLDITWISSLMISVCLEYMNRKTDGDIPTTTISSDLDVNSLSLRVGLSF